MSEFVETHTQCVFSTQINEHPISLAGKLKAVYILLYVLVLTHTHTLMPVGFRIDVCIGVCECESVSVYVSMSVTYAFSHQYRSHFTRLPRQLNGCWWSIPRWVDSWPEGWANGEACTIFSYCMNVGKTVPPLKGLYLHTDIEHSDCNFKKIDGLVEAPFCKKASFGTDVSEGH